MDWQKFFVLMLGGGVLLFAWNETNAAWQIITTQGDTVNDPDAATTSYDPDMTTVTPNNLTEGESNNNPGNLRYSPNNNWVGQVGQDSRGFIIFDNWQHGIRAMTLLLQNYSERYGLNTVRGLISRYAPSSENPTNNYVAFVAEQMGVDPDAALDMSNPATYQSLVAAQIQFEQGRNVYTLGAVAEVINDALTVA